MWILLIVLFIMVLLSSPHWRRALAIKRWRNALALDKHQATHLQLYATVNGFSLSRDARSEQDAMEYVYGEIEFIPFIALLSLTNPDHNTIFYDLGSGTGKAVLACAMVFNIKQSNGIELFRTLHNAACETKDDLSRIPGYSDKADQVHFIQGDFLHAEFSDATLIFINATGFFGQTWDAISQRLERELHCTTVITTSKALKSSAFNITKITNVQMSWGIVSAYIQQRIKTA